jgi:hypothetical protein
MQCAASANMRAEELQRAAAAPSFDTPAAQAAQDQRGSQCAKKSSASWMFCRMFAGLVQQAGRITPLADKPRTP